MHGDAHASVVTQSPLQKGELDQTRLDVVIARIQF